MMISFLHSNILDFTQKLPHAHVGIFAIDLSTNKILLNLNEDEFFIPASLQKIVTSMSALSLLGEDFVFKTTLSYEGSIDPSGCLHGNVWITGGGDPELNLSIIDEWQRALNKAHITRIEGKIYVNTSLFESLMASPYWYFQDIGNYYGAGASSLSINQNLYRVTFKPGKHLGDPAQVIKLDPEIPGLIIHNEVTTGPEKSGDHVCIYGMEYSPEQFYRGTVPIDEPSFTVKGAIYDPPLFTANLLAQRINPSQGVEIVRSAPSLRTPLHEHISRPLKAMLFDMNQHSTNIVAEHLFKQIGLGEGETACHLIQNFLKELSIPTQIKDGSGGARNNLITPRGMTTLLSQMTKKNIYLPLRASFPEAGKSGTLLNFPSTAHLSIRAKTGFMTNIYNLAGIITCENGREIAFAFFCNHHTANLLDVKNIYYDLIVYLSKNDSSIHKG